MWRLCTVDAGSFNFDGGDFVRIQVSGETLFQVEETLFQDDKLLYRDNGSRSHNVNNQFAMSRPCLSGDQR